MATTLVDAIFLSSTVPQNKIYELYAVKIRKCMINMSICLEWRTFLTFFWLLVLTLELTEDPDILADTIQKSLCMDEKKAVTLGDRVIRTHREVKAREDYSLDQKERALLQRYSNREIVGKPNLNELLSSRHLQSVDSIAASLVEVSLSIINTISSFYQSNEAYNTLWIVPHVMTPKLRDSLLIDLSVFAERITVSEFTLGEHNQTIRGFAAHFPTVHAICLCIYSICRQNFLVGATLRDSNIYAYVEKSVYNLRTLSEYVETTPIVSDIEFLSSSSETSELIDEPAIKKFQNHIVHNINIDNKKAVLSNSTIHAPESKEYRAQRDEEDNALYFANPDCVVKLTNIPDIYRGAKFKQLKILKGKTPPELVLHGEENDAYVMYIEFKHTTPLQKFIEACRKPRDKTVKIQATQGDLPSNYSTLEVLDPKDIWYNAAAFTEERKETGADSTAQGPVVEVTNLPKMYRNLKRKEDFWCGEHRPLLWWNLLSQVTQDNRNKGTFYFYFKYREGKEASSAKWFKKCLSNALGEEGVKDVSINILTEVPSKTDYRSVEVPTLK